MIDRIHPTAAGDTSPPAPAPVMANSVAAGADEIEVVRRDDARRTRQALETLPPEQRRAIELAYFDGFTHAQIAEVLMLPAGTVKGRIRLGLQKLRYALQPGIPASSATIDSWPLAAGRPVRD